VLVRLLLAQLSDRAKRSLDRLHTAAAAEDRTGSDIEIQELRAPWPWRPPTSGPARWTPWARTLALAHPHGYVRVFAMDPPSFPRFGVSIKPRAVHHSLSDELG
jgi:hypothetical protein